MSTEQHDAYGEELARISQHQSDAVTARITMVEALTLAGVSPAQANELVSKLEAGAVAGAHTWISENSPPPGSEQAFEDGWFQGVRAVASERRVARAPGAASCDKRAVVPATMRDVVEHDCVFVRLSGMNHESRGRVVIR
ncbi:hypothetical protein [Streptomyces sp. NPDC094472]|uniref:hypothetical protein n=1 Tax=Streptomyces sp. NPDC094472 TaxID=3155080 RepID=UPI0033184971